MPDGQVPLIDMAHIVKLGGSLITNALTQQLVIPEFEGFCEELQKIYDTVASLEGGTVSDYIEQLSSIDPTKFGVSITSIDGQKFNIGDADELFCLQSTVMPVTYACALDESGPEKVHNHVGKEPSGRSFNEICLKQIPETERVVPERTAIPHNPLINAGALVCTSLIRPKESLASRLKYYLDVWSDLCGKPVSFDPTVMMAERAHADRNYALAYMMYETGTFEEGVDLDETLELYFSTCSVCCTADMVSTAAACLANGGVSPLSNKRIFSETTTRQVLSLMLSCGMYDFSGEWAFSVGLPAKSSISGIVQLVVPNVCGICIWSPPLAQTGSSHKGIKFALELVDKFAFHHLDHKGKSKKIDPTNKHHRSFELLQAAASGDVKTCTLLLARGYSVNCADYDQRTALHLACAEARFQTVELLLQEGADPNLTDRWDRTPMHDAVASADADVLRVMEAAVDTANSSLRRS